MPPEGAEIIPTGGKLEEEVNAYTTFPNALTDLMFPVGLADVDPFV